VEGRGLKRVERSRVIVVQVGEHHVGNRRRVDPGTLQQRRGLVQQRAVPFLRCVFPESRINDDEAAVPADHPDVIVERHRRIVEVHPRHEVFASRPVRIRRRIAQGEHFIGGVHGVLQKSNSTRLELSYRHVV